MAGKNVLGTDLAMCGADPMTGFYRDGCCNTGAHDAGLHVVCVQVTAEFLQFSKSKGNDLTTPNPMYQFPGLVPGDRWCLCAARWKEAYDDGMAPPVVLEACHISTLEFASLEELQEHAVEPVGRGQFVQRPAPLLLFAMLLVECFDGQAKVLGHRLAFLLVKPHESGRARATVAALRATETQAVFVPRRIFLHFWHLQIVEESERRCAAFIPTRPR